jgi:hypothetical protein
MLTRDDRLLIEKRRKALRFLPLATWLLPALWLVVCVVTFLRYPLIANPWRVLDAIRDRTLDRTSLESLCALTPLVVILLQVVVIAFLVMGLGMLHRERRLLDRLENAGFTPDSSDPRVPADSE